MLSAARRILLSAQVLRKARIPTVLRNSRCLSKLQSDFAEDMKYFPHNSVFEDGFVDDFIPDFEIADVDEMKFTLTSSPTVAVYATRTSLESVTLKEFTHFMWDLLSTGDTDDVRVLVDQIGHRFGFKSEVRWRKSRLPLNSVSLLDKYEEVLSYGVTVSQVLQNPEVLLRSRAFLDKNMNWLKTNNYRTVTVSLLLWARTNTLKTVQGLGYTRGESWLEILAHKLNCSVVAVVKDLRGNSGKLRAYSKKNVTERIDLLLKHGATTEMVRTSPHVLSWSYETLRRRIDILKANSLIDPFPVVWLTQNHRQFERTIKTVLEYNKIHTDLGNQYAYVAKLLNVSISSAEESLKTFNLSLIVKKIELVRSMGFTGEQMLLYPRVFRLSMKRLEMAKTHFDSIDHNIRLPQIYGFARNNRIQLHRNSVYQRRILAKILSTSVSYLDKFCPYLQPAMSFSEKEFCESRHLLLSHGFELKDVAQCPLLFNHVPDVLEKYLNDLDDYKQLAPFSGWVDNPVKLLNAIQYLIEKDLNFSEIGYRAKNETQIEVDPDFVHLNVYNEVEENDALKI